MAILRSSAASCRPIGATAATSSRASCSNPAAINAPSDGRVPRATGGGATGAALLSSTASSAGSSARAAPSAAPLPRPPRRRPRRRRERARSASVAPSPSPGAAGASAALSSSALSPLGPSSSASSEPPSSAPSTAVKMRVDSSSARSGSQGGSGLALVAAGHRSLGGLGRCRRGAVCGIVFGTSEPPGGHRSLQERGAREGGGAGRRGRPPEPPA